ncbi:MAG TPA: hypothetical protein VN725_01110 [Rhodanobacteraceae bacterium]|nr:hypothetical protein [Rhodanobacteraceae bacterium]
MSSITLTSSVTLSGSSGLDVHDHGAPIPVPAETDATNLIWELTGTAAQGSFNAMNATNPGFAWVDTPPSGIFGTPTLGANGNQITITDNHINSNSGGSWRYKLCATVNGQPYSTTASVSPRGTTDNPTIKNN